MSVRTHRSGIRPLGANATLVFALGSLGGCAGAPSVTVAGAFFPAWLACGLLALVAAAVFRATFIATGLAQTLPMQFFVCLAMGALVGALVWALWIGL